MLDMDIQIHRSKDRGMTKLPWLESRHSFSFGSYRNPQRMHFGMLRVLNDDRILGGKGFGMHMHDNMEILSIVLEGSLEHKDSKGNHGIIKQNEIQHISAGKGIQHSEFNHSKTVKCRFLQIWIEPNEYDIEPSYQQQKIPQKDNDFSLIVSNKKGTSSVLLHQNAFISIGHFDEKKSANYTPNHTGNGIFLYVLDGLVEVQKQSIEPGDSAEIAKADAIELAFKKPSTVLLIEVPMA